MSQVQKPKGTRGEVRQFLMQPLGRTLNSIHNLAYYLGVMSCSGLAEELSEERLIEKF